MDCKIKEGTLENVVNVIHWRLKASNDNITDTTTLRAFKIEN